MRMVVQVDQCIESRIGLQIDTSATPAVTAIRAAHGYVLGAVKVLGAAAAVTSTNVDLYLVIKLHSVVPLLNYPTQKPPALIPVRALVVTACMKKWR